MTQRRDCIMTPHFLIWSFGPKIGSVDGICHQTDSVNRFYLDVKTGPTHLRLVKQIQPRPPSLLFRKLKPIVPLSEVRLVRTAPVRARSHYTGTRLIGSCHYLPQHVVVTRSNIFGLQHYLAEAFPSRPDRLFRPVVGVRQLSHAVG